MKNDTVEHLILLVAKLCAVVQRELCTVANVDSFDGMEKIISIKRELLDILKRELELEANVKTTI